MSADAKKYSVLIVDDLENWLKLLTELLQGEFTVTPLTSYSDALNTIRTQSPPFHVVITDMRLKDDESSNEDGIRLIEELNKRVDDTKVILVTGYPTIASANKAGKLKAEYLEKHPSDGTPFNVAAFIAIVRKAAEDAEKARIASRIDIFVVMPFASDYDPIYEYIQEIAQTMKRVCKRADRPLGSEASGDIMTDIDYGIENAEVVIAELSDIKPNVLFESGVSYAWQKKVILIAQKSEEKNIPEILSRRRIIFYPGKLGGEKILKDGLRGRLKEEFAKGKAKRTLPTVGSSLCFVITSPEEDGHDTFGAIIKRSVDKAGMKSIYLWDKTNWDRPGAGIGKHAMIEEKLREAGSVVADLSWNDPTTFYLAGLAYGLRKKYKFLYRQDKKPPFDIRHLNLIRYSKDSEVEREDARNDLYEWLQTVLESQPMSRLPIDANVNLFPQTTQEGKQSTHILFLAAEPTDQVRLRLGQEFREIREELSKSRERNLFNLELPELSLRPRDITRALLESNASIIHFSGHSGAEGQLFFETVDGSALPVEPIILANLFKQLSKKIKCVILNACYSEKQAKAISRHIDYVVGMKRGISDNAAIAFSIGFYQALGAGKNIEDAFELGKIQSGLQSAPEYQIPVLLKRG